MKQIIVLLASLLLTPALSPAQGTSPAAIHAADAPGPKPNVVCSVVAGIAPSAGQERLPPFSWERVPCYMHIRKDTAFTPDEIRYLAAFPLVTFEKSTGDKDFGSTEKGTLTAARAIKAINPATKVLYYRNVIVHYGGYAANTSLTGIPGAFLVGRDGSDKLVRNRVQAYDLTNKALRDGWLANAREVCADPAIDGLFVDGVVKVLEPAYLRSEIGEEKKSAVVAGYEAMMKDARQILGPEKLMVANVLRARFVDSGISRLRAFDGSYIEGFEDAVGKVSKKDYVGKGIAAFQEAAQQGFLIAFTGGLGQEVEDEGGNEQFTDEIRKPLMQDEAVKRRFSYLLSLFLICAEKHSYFYAHDGYDAKKSKVWMTRPPEFDRPLGAPKGPAVRSGYIYTREFAHASVRLDVEKQTGDIDFR